MNTWWYIHTATLYQCSSLLTRDDIYIPQLYINFPADEQLMIYTYHNFISIFQQMNKWWDIHTATLYQLSCRWTRDDMYIPQLYINFPADEHVMIYTYRTFFINFAADEHLMRYTYRNFISIFLQMNTWWYIHTATLFQFSCRWRRNDIFILQLYMNFLVMNTGWYIHIATLYQFSSRWTRDDIYIPQLYINFPADEHLLIYTYHNCISILEQMNTWW